MSRTLVGTLHELSNVDDDDDDAAMVENNEFGWFFEFMSQSTHTLEMSKNGSAGVM